jgi:hypothetical protein
MRMTTTHAETERKRRTGLPAALQNTTAEQRRVDFAAWFAHFQAFARAKTPVGAKMLVCQGRFRRCSR